MKKIALFFFSLFLLLTSLYIWENHLPKQNRFVQKFNSEMNETKFKKNLNKIKVVEEVKKDNNKQIAYAEIIKSPESGSEVVKVHLPSGKRLYNEEKMNEIAASANLEISTNEN